MGKFDVIVVGAGTAGCLTAIQVAKSGLNVALMDLKGGEDIGKKVCGDAIGKHHFDRLGLRYPDGEELERKVEGILIFSPNKEAVYRIGGSGLEGFIVNRYLFGQRLLKEALDAGATLHENIRVLKPIIEKEAVVGVEAKRSKEAVKKEFRSDIVIDASGMSAVIRRNLPKEFGIEKDPDREDVVVCYREIRLLKEQLPDPGYLRIYLDAQITPGGYSWIFPEGGDKVNVGLGTATKAGFPNPKKQLYKEILSQPLFEGSKVVEGGGGQVTTRRPLDKMVADGLMIIGDAAFQANPIHGGGIGSSMRAGKLSGEVAVKAIEDEDVSAPNLWIYNMNYTRDYGAKQAGLDIFRIFLQLLDNEDLNYGMEKMLIAGEDLLMISMGGDVKLNLTQKTFRLLKGLGKIDLVRKLRRMSRMVRKAKRHYRLYPSTPDGFQAWRAKTLKLVEEAKSRLK